MPGYGPDVEKSRAEARKIMESSATAPTTGSDQGATRNIAPYRDPAVILIDQLKQIYIDGDLETIDTRSGTPR